MGQVPGLVPEGDGQPIDGYDHTGSVDDTPSAQESTDADTPSADVEATPAGEDKAEPTDQDTPDQANPPSPYNFRGKSFQTPEELYDHFEQVLSSREGHVRKEQEKAAEFEKQLQQYWSYIEELEGKKPSTEPTKETKPAEATSVVDIKKIQNIIEIAKRQGWDPTVVGLQVMAEELSKSFDAKLDQKLASVSEPIQQIQRYGEEVANQQSLFRWAQSVTDADGTAVYPELGATPEGLTNPDAVKYIYVAWDELSKADPQFAYSQLGFDYAYKVGKELIEEAAEYERKQNPAGHGTRPAPSQGSATTPSGATPSRDEKGRFVSEVRASGDLVGTNVSPVAVGRKLTEEEAILKRMANTKPVKRGETNLGFYE